MRRLSLEGMLQKTEFWVFSMNKKVSRCAPKYEKLEFQQPLHPQSRWEGHNRRFVASKREFCLCLPWFDKSMTPVLCAALTAFAHHFSDKKAEAQFFNECLQEIKGVILVTTGTIDPAGLPAVVNASYIMLLGVQIED